jgi:cytochrome P450
MRVFNPFDYEFHRDPYPTYEWLREEEPAYHNADMGFYALSRFDDVLWGLHDPATFTSTGGIALEGFVGEHRSMIEYDPPEHTELRRLISRRFTPRAVAVLEDTVRSRSAELLNQLEGRDSFDVVKEYAAHVPTTVVATMLGIPREHHDDVRTWTDQLLHREQGSAEVPPSALEAQIKIATLVARIIAERRDSPRDDLISHLCGCQLDGRPLDDGEIIGFCALLIAGGHETTAKLIAGGVRLLAAHPDQRSEVIAQPQLFAAAIEEILRYTSPTQYMARTLTRDVELHGVTMLAGTKVALLLGSGNRDPRQFDEPDRFDIHRANSRVLSLGHGAHHCLGAAVLRLESRIALQAFHDRHPVYAVDETGIEVMHSGNVHGPVTMPVSVAL